MDGAPDGARPLDAELAACWHRAYEAVVQRAAHEVNNALNAVAMNLEVAQLRAVPGADAGRVAPFTAAAAEAHEEVIAMVRPLMALARTSPAGACDVREVAGQVAALLRPGVSARGGALLLAGTDAAARTAAPAVAVRAAVAAVLAAATADGSATVECRVAADPAPTLTVVVADALAVHQTVVATWARAGIEFRRNRVANELVFPSA